MLRDSLRNGVFQGVHPLRYFIVFAAALMLVLGLTAPPVRAQEAAQPDAGVSDVADVTGQDEPPVVEQPAKPAADRPAESPDTAVVDGVLGDAAANTFDADGEVALQLGERVAPIEIDEITIDNPHGDDKPLIQWQHFTVKWAWHAVGDLKEGDKFTIEFPEQFQLPLTETFNLSSDTDGPSADNGFCVASHLPKPGNIVCTIGKNFAQKDDVRGEISIRAQAVSAWDQQDVAFKINGGQLKSARLPGPNGTIVGQIDEAPTYPVKWGWYHEDQKSVSWRIHIPGPEAAKLGDSPMVIHDELTGHPHVYAADSWRAGEYTIVEKTGTDTDKRSREPVEVLTVQVEMNAENTSAKVTVSPPKNGWDKDRYYLVEYRTTTRDGQDAPFDAVTWNKADIGVIGSLKRSVSRSQTGAGNIRGVDRKSVMVHKKLAADSAPVPAGTVFKVLAEYTLNGELVKEYIEVPLDGSKAGQKELPRGTKVTLSEPNFPEVAGLSFENPVFAPLTPGDSNVKILEGGAKAEVTTINEDNVQVVVTNKAVANKATFTVAKKIAGLSDDWMHIARRKEYTFNYQCGAGAENSGKITVKGDGEVVAVGKTFPVGTECTVTEDAKSAQIEGVELTTDEAAMKQTLKLGPEAGAVAAFKFTNTYKGGGVVPKGRNVPWWLLLVPFALGAAGSSQSGGGNGAQQTPSQPAQNQPAQNQSTQPGGQGTGATNTHGAASKATLANTGASVLGVIAIAAIAVAAGVFMIRRGRKER